MHRDDYPDDGYEQCPVCAQPIDYCQGHGEIGDPAGFLGATAHDRDDHSRCDPRACPNTEQEG